jgi:hypothetical protein
MKLWLKTMSVFLAGLGLVISGFMYLMIFSGLPYLDPSPAQQANWSFHNSVGEYIVLAGIFFLLTGLIAAPFIRARLKQED